MEIDRSGYIEFKDGTGNNHGFGFMIHFGNYKTPFDKNYRISTYHK